MAKAKTNLSPKAKYVKYGYGQVEGNKLSARYNGKIFASLPCSADITCVENGMFLVYDYANRMVSLPDGNMEPMLVFNEVKVYEDRETDADFAMLADNYSAIVYNATADGRYSHYIPGTGPNITIDHESATVTPVKDSTHIVTEYDNTDFKNKDASDEHVNPYGMMARGMKGQAKKVNAIVPRLFKTDIGDIMTTNCIVDDIGGLKVGDNLGVGTDGYLKKDETGGYTDMTWTVVQVYTMPDLQPGVKIMRTK